MSSETRILFFLILREFIPSASKYKTFYFSLEANNSIHIKNILWNTCLYIYIYKMFLKCRVLFFSTCCKVLFFAQ